MKTIVIEKEARLVEIAKDLLINECDVDRDELLLAVKDGYVEGMIVREAHDRWILRLKGNVGCSGFHKTRKECVADAIKYNCTICIDCEVK